MLTEIEKRAEKMLRKMEQDHVKILAHVQKRQLLVAYAVDIKAKQTNIFVINQSADGNLSKPNKIGILSR